jgi:ribosomal protein S8
MSFVLLAELISQLNLASRRKLKSIKVKYNKTNLKILFMLQEEQCILAFMQKDAYILVYLKYTSKNSCVFKSIKLISKNKKIGIQSRKDYHNFFYKKNRSGFFILLTNLGYFSSNDLNLLSLENVIGGKLLLRVVY